ncbi:MAG: hypothetical protein APU95_00695 [Hadesarchaea archaeon YNP_N21]|jgi:uncharacterized 2Fe-2S/4Fe-4S cluster protein (DUF4445 family)|nr:MAG: hypothetical protein APU95_00695 [Hadesarchaea archaeon YNP_N21]
MRKIARVVFLPEGKRGEAAVGESILKVANRLGVDINSLCGGFGTCGKCRVVVVRGGESLNDPSSSEKRFLNENELGMGYRLACEAVISEAGDLIIEIPAESRVGRQILQIEGVETQVKLEPLVKKIVVKVQSPTLENAIADAERLFAAIEKQFSLRVKISPESLKKLPMVLRKDSTVSVTLWRDEIVDVEPGVSDELLGFAVDIGTTKMAGYLVDLNTGKVLSVSSRMNPQIRYGEDIMSRITYVVREEGGLRDMQGAVIEAINEMMDEACGIAGKRKENIYEMVAVGNTAMHHFFLGLPPNFLGLSPYPPVIQGSVDVRAKELSVKMCPDGNVHVLPVIAGFVGADNVGVILSTEIYKSDVLTLAMDIGTNTEILLGDKNELMVCSTASGPAFEGAHIKHGMRAATGAIEKIKIAKNFEVDYQTIGGAKPRGLCGSAIVDALAEMLKAGALDRSGRINLKLETPRVRVGKDGVPEFVIAWKDETSIGEDITVTQKDVRELQLAKAAMFTGVRILMKKKKVSRKDLGSVVIAGAFGSHINPESAMAIGMFPGVPLDRVRSVGNAAGSGARMALMSGKARELAGRISRRVKYVELAADAEFQREFLSAMYLPHENPELFD